MRHELKTWPGPFNATWDGEKVHEVRLDDRAGGFNRGDLVVLREWVPSVARSRAGYTGREVHAIVTHVTLGPDFGLPKGLAVLSVRAHGKRSDGPRS